MKKKFNDKVKVHTTGGGAQYVLYTPEPITDEMILSRLHKSHRPSLYDDFIGGNQMFETLDRNKAPSLEELRIVVDATLDDEELQRAAGCVGYAFKKHFQGEGLSDPYDVFRRNGNTSFSMKPTSWYNDRPEVFDEFAADVRTFIWAGTPTRTTNRAGPKGTRLVEGIQHSAEVFFLQEETSTHKVVVLVDGKEWYSTEFEVPRNGSIDDFVLDALEELFVTQ